MQFLLALVLPTVAFAQTTGTGTTVKQLMWKVSYNILNPLIQLGFVIALLWFLWGVVEYIRKRSSGHVWDSSAVGGPDQQGKSADNVVYGLFGLFIMVSAFGILQLIKTVIGSDIPVPQ